MSGFKKGRYDLTATQAARWHGADNCCPWGQEDFLDRIWRLHAQPAGFDRHDHPSKAVLCLTGPGTASRRTDRLFQALREPPIPKSERTEGGGGQDRRRLSSVE